MNLYKRIGMACRAIPAGTVATYGQIALLCGRPRHSRRVDLKRFQWKNTLEDARRLRDEFEAAGI